MYTVELINNEIVSYNERIERNEREQDAYMATYGEMNQKLYDRHEELVDELCGLLTLRRILK